MNHLVGSIKAAISASVPLIQLLADLPVLQKAVVEKAKSSIIKEMKPLIIKEVKPSIIEEAKARALETLNATGRIQIKGKSDFEQIDFMWYFNRSAEMKTLSPTPEERFELLLNMKVTLVPFALIDGKVQAGWVLIPFDGNDYQFARDSYVRE